MSTARYRLVIVGELGPRFAFAFDGMTVRAHDGETEIVGPIIDQSHLHGLLERIASLGLTLRSLAPCEPENTEADTRPQAQPAHGNSHKPGADWKGP
jgi:hypothetical protein